MKERISVSPQVHFGKPCVAGTRISVQSVLELVREGLSFSQIIQDYLYCNSSSAWFCLRRGRDSASSRGPVCSSHPSFPVAVSASVL